MFVYACGIKCVCLFVSFILAPVYSTFGNVHDVSAGVMQTEEEGHTHELFIFHFSF